MKIHIIGINGSGAKAVAYLASKYGYEVDGCDKDSGGHSTSHLEGVDLALISPALLYSKPLPEEVTSAKKKGILMSWQEFVGKYLMKDKYVIAVCGTHGKSTTTAMIGQIMEEAGYDPTVLVGGYVPKWKANARYGKSKYFVIEADEFNDNFLNYKPDIIALNNVEFDHPDYFKNIDDVLKSFDKFKKQLKPGGVIIETKDLANTKFKLKLLGEHNQKNANMAYAVCKKVGVSPSVITKALENFKGVGRRMELIGERNKTSIYDDYAHHPTAIKSTLNALREKYPKQKILAVIEPHGYKRTKALLPLYKNVFDGVDKVIIGPIFKARDKVDPNFSTQEIVSLNKDKDVLALENEDEVLKNTRLALAKYDIIIFMGAGNSSLWAKKLLNSTQR